MSVGIWGTTCLQSWRTIRRRKGPSCQEFIEPRVVAAVNEAEVK